MADDPVRKHILDRAKISPAFTSGMFGDVGELNLVRAGCGELVPGPTMLVNSREEIVMGQRSEFAGPALLFGVRSMDPGDLARPVNPILTGGDPDILEFVGEEPVAQGRVILMDLDQPVDDLRVVHIPATSRVFEPFVMRLG